MKNETSMLNPRDVWQFQVCAHILQHHSHQTVLSNLCPTENELASAACLNEEYDRSEVVCFSSSNSYTWWLS